VLRDFARSMDTAANLLVIKTPPGSAHLIGVALDHSDLPEIVGTICGDDTLFIACGSPEAAAELATRLRSGSGNLQ
jgi:transcriptional regulator of arginine metabolism